MNNSLKKHNKHSYFVSLSDSTSKDLGTNKPASVLCSSTLRFSSGFRGSTAVLMISLLIFPGCLRMLVQEQFSSMYT